MDDRVRSVGAVEEQTLVRVDAWQTRDASTPTCKSLNNDDMVAGSRTSLY